MNYSGLADAQFFVLFPTFCFAFESMADRASRRPLYARQSVPEAAISFFTLSDFGVCGAAF